MGCRNWRPCLIHVPFVALAGCLTAAQLSAVAQITRFPAPFTVSAGRGHIQDAATRATGGVYYQGFLLVPPLRRTKQRKSRSDLENNFLAYMNSSVYRTKEECLVSPHDALYRRWSKEEILRISETAYESPDTMIHQPGRGQTPASRAETSVLPPSQEEEEVRKCSLYVSVST